MFLQVGFMVQTYSDKLAGLELELFHQVVNSLVFGSQHVSRRGIQLSLFGWFCAGAQKQIHHSLFPSAATSVFAVEGLAPLKLLVFGRTISSRSTRMP